MKKVEFLSTKNVMDLQCGDVVRAKKNLDPECGDVPKGMTGVIFEESKTEDDYTYGPIVRWASWTVCNVYQGDVEFLWR